MPNPFPHARLLPDILAPPGVQALLRKLQSLVEVPGRLRRWAALGADPARALHCYARARAVLRHYRHLPSFRAIEDESHAIMAELAQRLRARLRYGHSAARCQQEVGLWGCSLWSLLVAALENRGCLFWRVTIAVPLTTLFHWELEHADAMKSSFLLCFSIIIVNSEAY